MKWYLSRAGSDSSPNRLQFLRRKRPDTRWLTTVYDQTRHENNFQHGDMCVRLLTALSHYARAKRLGVVLDSSTGFWMGNDNCRAPDISFVSKGRLGGLKRPPPTFFQGAPDLAVEILAPSNTPQEITARLKDYFSSGTRLAWIIHPDGQFVEVCNSPTKRRIVGRAGDLADRDALP